MEDGKQDSSASVVWRLLDSVPGMTVFFSSPLNPDLLCGPHRLLPRRVNGPGREADHLPPNTAVKNA
jgi:hypothetical protein